ncbi:MAG: hypothetical protein M1823_005722, partial [Watsoniomyces obsoletus]
LLNNRYGQTWFIGIGTSILNALLSIRLHHDHYWTLSLFVREAVHREAPTPGGNLPTGSMWSWNRQFLRLSPFRLPRDRLRNLVRKQHLLGRRNNYS